MNAIITESPILSVEDTLPPQEVVLGCSAAMRSVWEKLERIAKLNVPVLIHGESGTGKEVIAKLIHRHSSWHNGPFVKITCPAIPAALLESELFGYEKGAFTGAHSVKPGRVEAASQGTLFLDEIGELEFGLQAKLLQVLQDGTYTRIGGQKEKRMDVRLISATNRDLKSEIENDRFREDLFYRINGVSIRMPALRERKEDIFEIANYLLRTYSQKFKTCPPRLSLAFINRLQQHRWPGNIRELENVMRRYALLQSDEEVFNELVAYSTPMVYLNVPAGEGVQLKDLTQQATRQVEETVIRAVLDRNNGNRKATAKALGISYRMLLYKLRAMEVPSLRRSRHFYGDAVGSQDAD